MKSKLFVLFVLTVLLCQKSVFAHEEMNQPASRPHEFFHGFYIGQGVGVAFNTANVDLRKNAFRDGRIPQVDGTLNHFSTMDLYQNRLYGEFYGGWSYQFCMGLHIGARAGVNFSSFGIIHKEKTIESNPTSLTINGFTHQEIEIESKIRSVDYTIDGKVGWAFGLDTMVYFLIGGALNKPEAVLKTDSMLEFLIAGVPSSKQRIVDKGSSKKYRLNLHFGFGIEQKLFEHLGLDILYSFTNYSERIVRVSGQDDTVGGNTLGYSSKLKSQIKRHAFTAGLAYHF